jgi:hypothetical protein
VHIATIAYVLCCISQNYKNQEADVFPVVPVTHVPATHAIFDQNTLASFNYFLEPVLFFANTDVSTTKMCLDTSILAKSIMDWREYILYIQSIWTHEFHHRFVFSHIQMSFS